MNRYRQFKRCLASALSAMMLVTGLPVNTFAAPDVDQKITIDIEKTWQDGNNAEGKRPASVDVQLKNGDEVVQTLTITPDEEGNWKGSFEDVPRYDSGGKEIKYQVEEVPVDGYTSEITQGEVESDYEYPAIISDAELDTSTTDTDTIHATGGTNWDIKPGLRVDKVEATQAVFTNMAMNKAVLTEYDKDGNLVPSGERVFKNENGGNIWFYPKTLSEDGKYWVTDHYFTLTFDDAVTILDGTATGSTQDAVITVTNISIYKKQSGTKSRLFYGTTDFWAGPSSTKYSLGGLSMDLNFKIPGVDSGQVLLSFTDIDVTSDGGTTGDPRNECVYLLDGFDPVVYTIPLESTNPAQVHHTRFLETADGYFRASSIRLDNSQDLNGGFVARANISSDGFDLRWTGYGCGTQYFSMVSPFEVKKTVDGLTAGGTGGTISDQSGWKYRNYGEAQVVTMTPDDGYHIASITIDGKTVDLSELEEKGTVTVPATGWTENGHTGTEDITFYQRADGVVDAYLPKQFFAVGTKVAARIDHWVDVSFTPNGVAQEYTVANTLVEDLMGTKTWVSGDTTHVVNEALVLNLTQVDGTTETPYKYDKDTQLSWNGNTFTIKGLPKYSESGNAYVYKLTEGPVAGFDTTYSDNDGDGNYYDITNTLKQEYITVQGKKTWKDGGKYPHNNAEEITVTLKRSSVTNGKNLSETLELVPTWEGDTYKFENLPRYNDERYEYKYTVTETIKTPDYLEEGDYYASATDDTGRNFVNTLRGSTSFSGTKTWKEGESAGQHDNSKDVTLVLYCESETVRKKQAGGGQYAVSWNGNTYSYSGLPKYDSSGYPYTYSVRENRVAGKAAKDADYDIYYDDATEPWDRTDYSITGKDITNTRTETIDVSGEKIWVDKDPDKTHKNETEVSLTLYRMSKKPGSQKEEVTAEAGEATAAASVTPTWSGNTYTFASLPKYDKEGYTYVYTVEETPIDHYDRTYDENDPLKITNTYKAKGEFQLAAIKKLVGRNWKTDEKYTFTLYDAAGKAVETLDYSADGSQNFKSIKVTQDDFDAADYKDGVGRKTLTYRISETSALPGGVSKSGDITATVTLKDSGNGTISAEIAYTNEDTITNTYKAEGKLDTDTTPILKKTVEAAGTDWAPKTFEFKIAAVNPADAPLPEKDGAVNTTGTATFNQEGTQEIGFGTIKYTKAGEYSYTITEQKPAGADKDAWIYDNEPHTITVNVVDNLDGTLTATAEQVTITNTYKPEVLDTSVTPILTKTVESRELRFPEKTFEFEIEAIDGAPLAKDSTGKDITTGSATFSQKGTQTIDFGTIVYTEVGTYKYNVKETTPSDDLWICDNKTHEVVVTVVKQQDGQDGKLAITVTTKAAITNTYGPKVELDTFERAVLTKKVEAKDNGWASKTFDFVIEAVKPQDAPMPQKDGAAKTTGTAEFTSVGEKKIDFGTITFDHTGTYTYKVMETTTGENDGWTYDNEWHTFNVQVTQNSDGSLAAQTEKVVIINKYAAEGKLDTSVTPVLKKTVKIEGTTSTKWAPKEFEFEITPFGNAPFPKVEGSDGKLVDNTTGTAKFEKADTLTIDFGVITFNQAGRYTYQVTETTDLSGEEWKGWSCDNKGPKTVNIVVTDKKDGTLEAEVEGGRVAVITNTYKPTGTWDTDGNDTVAVNKTVKTDEPKTSLGATGKTFVFEISAGEGSAVYEDGTTGTAPLAPAQRGRSEYQTTGRITVTEDQIQDGTYTGAIDFGTIEFKKAGKYTYTITEKQDGGEGWTCTPESKAVTVDVTVVDDGNGNLVATPGTREIINEYKPEGELDTSTDTGAVLKKKVTAEGTAWAPKTFEFTLATVSDAAETPAEGTAGETAQAAPRTGTAIFNKADEQIISFDTLKYTKSGTYTYTLTETTESGDGWICDNEPKTVTVTVTDNGEGKLTAVVNEGAAQIENRYEPIGHLDTGDDDTAVLKKTVDANGSAWASKTFNFTIEAVDGAPLATESDASGGEKDRTEGSATFGEAGTKTIDFGVITFKKAGTYTYKVKEVEPKEGDTTWEKGTNGWTFGLKEKTVTVEVTDNGKGKLTADVKDGGAEIVNKYEPTGTDDTSTEAGAVLTKTVVTEHIADGTKWTPKTFDFEITAGTATYEDGKTTGTSPAPEKSTGKATFDKAGTQIIDFGKIIFHRGGTYTYKVKELEPKDWDTTGWTLDTKEHEVKITVTDNGDGTMTVTPVKAEIENKYSPEPAVLTGDTALKVRKVLSGPAELQEGQFSFTLASGSDAEPVETVTNAADGVATFGDLTFDEVGTYEFTITEVDDREYTDFDDNRYITYNTRPIEVVVEVTDTGKGRLEAKVTYDASTTVPTVENRYENRTYDVLKYWDDADNRLETRSDELTLRITGTATVEGDEFEVYPYSDTQKNIATVSDATRWSYTFENLPKYYMGTEISYTVEETDAPEGFTLASKSDADPDDPDKTNVVLINRTDAGDLAIKKLMNVASKDEIDSAHGDTPYTFLVEVTKENGEPLDVEAAFYTAYSKNYDEKKTEGKITGTVNFKDGKAYVDGAEGITLKANEIIRIVGLPAGATYTVTEKAGENLYEPVVFGGEGTIRKDKVSYVNFINREIVKDKLKIRKIWDDEGDYDGFRPAQVTFDVYRELDGEREDKPFKTVTLDEENSFTAFIDLDKELVATISDASKSEAVKNASASYADSAAGSKSTAASFSDAYVSDAFGEDGELLDGSIFNDLISVVRDVAGKVAHLFGLDDDVKVTWTAEEKEVKKDDLKYYTAGDAVYEQDDTDGFWTVSITNKHELMNPVWIDPPVEKIIKIRRGTITTDETFTFRMTGMTGNELFPDGAVIRKDSDGNYYMEVSVTGEGAKEFGKIAYDKAGTYKYRITEIDGGAKYYTYSKDYYEITVEVKVADGRLKETVTLKKNGSETISTVTTEDGVAGSKLDIAFTNEYDRTTGGGGSNTPGGGTPGGPGGRTPTSSTPADPGTPVIPEAPVPGALPKTGEPVGKAVPMLFAMLAMFGALFGFGKKRDDEDEE